MQKNEQFTDAERATLRGAIAAFMAEHPARAPLSLRFIDAAQAFVTKVGSAALSPRGRLAGSLAILLLIAGGGTSYAAQSALPGDPLYAIKINVNEKIAAALSGGLQGHAQYDAELAALRLEEAEKLATQNRLSVQASKEIRANLNQVTADFNSSIAQLATSSDAGAAAASDVQSDFVATLAAHAQVLTALTTAVPSASSSLTSIASAVDAHIAATREARTKIDVALAASSSIALASTTDNMQRSAVQALDDIQALVPQVAASLGTSSSEAVSAQANGVKESLAAGQQHLDRRSYEAAIGAFQSAIRSAQQTQAAVDIRVQLKQFAPALSLAVDALSADASDNASTTQLAATNTPSTAPADASSTQE